MTFEELKDGMKSMFSSLGAKTSDSNYAVGLYDKTSAEPKGLMGMSDLASVLGGTVTTYSGNSLDDLKTPGRYTCSSSLLPDGHVGVIDVIEVTGGRYVQTVYQPTVRRTIQRTFNGTSWGNWGNCNGFSCMSAEDLASLLGAQLTAIPNNADLNNYTSNGLYICGTGAIAQSLANNPCSVAFRLDVLYFSENVVLQRIISSDATKVYIRSKISNTWGSWYLYQGTAVS